MSEDIQAAERYLYTLTDRLGRMGSKTTLAKRRGIEAEYAQAYQRLVRLGVRPQIRRKYRSV